jgi:hypothetical protein
MKPLQASRVFEWIWLIGKLSNQKVIQIRFYAFHHPYIERFESEVWKDLKKTKKA